MSSTSLTFTPQGIPKWTVKELPEHWITLLEDEKHLKPWRTCGHCGATAASLGRKDLPRCLGCQNVKCADPQRYCDRACQRADWPAHKEACQRSVEFDKTIGEIMPPLLADFRRKEIRQAYRWSHALKPTAIRWAVIQAFIASSFTDPGSVCLHIQMKKSVATIAQSPVWPVAFEFKPMDREAVDTDGDQRPKGHFSLVISDTVEQKGAFYLDVLDKDGMDDFLPQWPWILGHCALMGDINPSIAEIRLQALISTTHQCEERDEYVHIQKFKAPKSFDRFDMTYEGLDAWMKIMYPVVASFGSKLATPCKVMKDNYGHLLSQCKPQDDYDGAESDD